MTANTVSVIIPVFNENENLLHVVREIQLSKYLAELIIVDDGSNSFTKKLIRQLNNIKLLVHSHNQGKTQALKTGFLHSRYPVVAFIDADILNFERKHFDSLVSPVVDGQYDITISQRSLEPLYYRLTGISAAISGERALRRRIIQKYPQIFNSVGSIKGYFFEVKMNREVLGHYRIARINFKGVDNCYKSKKYGLPGLIKDIRILTSIASYLGADEIKRQLKLVRSLPLI